LPVDIVLAPEWWHRNEGMVFDRDYFFHPLKRVESEQKMEKILYERWGNHGLGSKEPGPRPEVGAVHLAAGFVLSEMLGCEVDYHEAHPPQVVCAHRPELAIDLDEAFKSPAFKDVARLKDELKMKYNYITGDINWSGILNLALDVRGEPVFTDIMMTPEEAREYFRSISEVIERFVSFILPDTGSSSISVNRNVRHFTRPVFLHSECSHTMISTEDYETVLLDFDIAWSRKFRPFGIHYCGKDPDRHAASFAKIPHLDFLDVGWGGDVKKLREYLPNTFFNLRLSPVEIRTQDPEEIRNTIRRLVLDSGDPYLTGVCCINMDDTITDERIDAIFATVEELRQEI